jgi:hypothetical protein
VWKMTLIHILLLGLMGILLFRFLLFCIGFFEAGHIKRRKRDIQAKHFETNKKIFQFYMLILFLMLIISVLYIKLKVGGGR